MTQPSESIFDIAKGDPGVSRYLRKSLETIRSNSTDPDMRRQLDDVLAGRTGMREFGRSDAFARLMDRVPRQAYERAAAMSQEDLEKLAAQGQAVLERFRNQPPEDIVQPPPPPTETLRPAPPAPNPPGDRVISGTRRPNREQIVAPSDLGDDDDYYRDHQQRGWLV